ncbi:TPA: ArpU family transcriptional regulator [Bacillus cereus]|jgi:ArpU family phage transcriptional regulator|uniref:ArpU family phage packaging/lysis transcriptional regulator n=1 Tax=Bacillus cereus TaxID=1396 RepID=UPI0019272B1D|nr:ArpU family phage packaging/lysis transcriptional regulator [Bacillus cereus]MBL3768799.1 ArpU family transcriptional regulator [Bacillus cereus]MBL3881118.1 ArpU family transcriptional regulator [Bacillus cereus]HDR4392997.1 ArpU family transcriptional regulator [Bacillus cereus]HDR7980244.1 ArpU family transcriptional regulator [Bacillus cereus]HDR8076473.1 ArpU family transcriptional regulator [Bacillus cereus]
MNKQQKKEGENDLLQDVIIALHKYRVLKVKFQNKQEREALGVEILFPELKATRQEDPEERKKYIQYIQIKRALEEALDEDERKILEMKYMNTKILNDDYIYTMIGIKRRTFYRKKKSAIANFADALGIM